MDASKRRHGVKGRRRGNTLEYKGYIGVIEYDDEAGIFHGEVVNLRDVITFQGSCVEDLKESLKDSVEDYLDFCMQRGEEPEKPFSGRLLLRIEPELHREIYISAKREGKSINQLVNDALKKVVA